MPINPTFFFGLACDLASQPYVLISGGRSERERKLCLDTVASFPCHEGM